MTFPFVFVDPETAFSIDFRGMNIDPADVTALDVRLDAAHQGMLDIEAGKIKNPDEQRKVTHFTDRTEYPESELFKAVQTFAADLAAARIVGGSGKPFTQAVINGIGGSALGPQLMQFAINGPYWNELPPPDRRQMLKIYFTDNTDTAGVADLLPVLKLDETLIVTISKSGGTQETKNNMIAFMAAYERAGLTFARHACAITMRGSELDRTARGSHWLAVFEMADSIGGRTSETSVVGHLPAALAGIDFNSFLQGACTMDRWTRQRKTVDNPAYFLAVSWFLAGNGKGDKNMVIVPYSDRLLLFARYLQQLVMESLGKERDLDGNIVLQGLNVFGNKGGTDAHAFIQQLHDGRNDFFATFIEPLKDACHIPVNGNISMGDYLHGFECGLDAALRQNGRQTIQIRIPEVNTFYLGMLIALYERAVAFYAELIHINAFHQPGVQAYKLAAKSIIELNEAVQTRLAVCAPLEGTAAEIIKDLGLDNAAAADVEALLLKFAANPARTFQKYSIEASFKGENWVFTVKKG